MANRQYDDKNRGSIWRNERKETDNHPDFTGSLNVDGKDYWVSAWKRKEGASDRAPALSFSIKPKDERAKSNNQKDDMRTAHAQPQQAQGAQSSLSDEMCDEIPFAPEFR
jgi:hypothetical protein